ncbi:MAG: DNA polymerase III subunit gamma/tau [Victivallales bacterium]|jgi:DNA polymerase-3 subunit gamma/tau|nr:DNA polymerase III subunit gamma/tau [Victivallales bacterium]
MSEYQVIARKWRPQCFADVVGQEHVVRTLKNAIRQQRTAHAYLFVGQRGIGKTTLARIFAKAMNCLDPQDGEPCCKCASCLAIAEENNLDVVEIDAASRNTVGDMRELAEDVMYQPVTGRYKIYIIDEVHMLSSQAWNALLKTVEEPPAHVKFIFATTEVHKVLKTIISRCQRFDLLPIPTRLIAERLRLIADREGVAINDDAVNAIARAAEGGMRDAQSLLDQMIAFFAQGDSSAITGEQVLSLFGLTDRGDLDAILLSMLRNQPGEVVKVIATLAKKGKNLETLFDDLLDALRAVQLCAILPNPGEVLNETPETIERCVKFAKIVRPDSLQILLETIAPVGRVLHDALNKQVYLETILLKAMREAHAVRIDDVLARLNQLRTADELKFLELLPHEIKLATSEVVVIEVPKTAESSEEPPPEENSIVESAIAQDPIHEKSTVDVNENPTVEEPAEPIAFEEESAIVDSDPVVEEEIARPAPEVIAPEILPENNTPDLSPESKSGRRKRHSVINDDPKATTEALKNPIVHEIVDLFDGNVVDVHRPEKER